MGKKKADDDKFTLMDDIVEGFSDVTDGSIFDFDASDVTEEKDSDGDTDGEGPATNPVKSGTGTAAKQGRTGGPKPVPGKVEGVTIVSDDASDDKEKGKTVRKQEPTKGGKSGSGDSAPDPTKQPE